MQNTIHVILNAHIDPIWLWPWQAGLDAALATCRSAADRLDAHPDIFFTRGEAWVYDQIERVDPVLFARITGHVNTGRWNIVGGWWIQPDCNFPLGFAMRKQIALGRAYFLDRFGKFPDIGYNVDSFGHSAALPGLMRDAGQTRYVMMRPQEHEMALPARIFRWRGYADGPEVLTFRIAGAYCTPNTELNIDHLRRATTEIPPGAHDTMCFVGVGDHGGGPTERQLASLRKLTDAIDGWKLEFSTPERFFRAIESSGADLPLVIGELQMRAIGCFTVHRPIKLALRRAEHLAAMAEIAHGADPAPETGDAAALESSWRDVCFHSFHDTLGGTCLPSAYPQAMDQLGAAGASADRILQHSLRRQMSRLPDDPLQRIVLYNPSDRENIGYVRAEPWMNWEKFSPAMRLLDEQGSAIPHQVLLPEAVIASQAALLFHLKIAPGAMRIIRMDPDGGAATGDPGAAGIHIDDALKFPQGALSLPSLEIIDDPSDTWSHGLDRFSDVAQESAQWGPAHIADSGPLMWSRIHNGSIGRNLARIEYRIYRDEPIVEILLRVQWIERHRLLKFCIDAPARWENRIDGIMHGSLQRPCDGRELPIRDWTLLRGDKVNVGIVCPEVFALDATPRRCRLTLVRSPLLAHHEPKEADEWHGTPSDQGLHEFHIWIGFGNEIAPELLERVAHHFHRPPLMADLTRGMPVKA